MLHGISWHTYLWIILVAIITFYAFLFLLCYKKEYKQFFKHIREGRLRFGTGEERMHDGHDIDSTHALLQELNDFFIAGVERRYTKDELTQALRLKLQGQNYSPNRQEEINVYISSECRKLCSIHLGEEDLRVLWE